MKIRQACDRDLEAIREIFQACYGQDYAYPDYYNVSVLKKLIYSDDTLILVAEDEVTGRIAGTASVVEDIGAYADLVGEFGRLAVHPDFLRQGIGKQLMQSRVEHVRERLHVGLVENRVRHPFSQKISAAHGFVPIGLLPMKLLVDRRESIALYVRHFGDALRLRKNNPRVIPEVYPLANLALENCCLATDAIVDDSSAPYPHEQHYELDQLTTQGYATLMHFERGRVKHREIFGPLRLHYGLFKLKARHSNYLLARAGNQIAGAIGFTVDQYEKAARVFELISLGDEPIHFLLQRLIDACRDELDVQYIEVDVSAHAPRMQRTLLELGFLPSAFVPAMVFHEVERLDIVKMVRLLVPLDTGSMELVEKARPIADLVINQFIRREVEPSVVAAAGQSMLLAGLDGEQLDCLAAICQRRIYQPGDTILVQNQREGELHLVLSGRVEITVGEAAAVGKIGEGEVLGEMSLLSSEPHSATAKATSRVETAVFPHDAVTRLVRQRPDIGVIIYRNLAAGLGQKLRRSDAHWLSGRS